MHQFEKPKRLQQIILPPYINRGQQRIIREKQKNISSVPFLDVELCYWYKVGCKQRGIHSRPYTYAVITLESLLILIVFLLLAIILQSINASPDAPINAFITQRNYFLRIQNSIATKRLVRSIDEYFYKQYRYLINGTIPISPSLIMIAMAAIMILTGPEEKYKRYIMCFLHLIILLISIIFIFPSLLQSQFQVRIFTSNNFIMTDDFLNAWIVIASYEAEKIAQNGIQLISLLEEKYNCCVVNRNALFWQQFPKHLILPYIYSLNFTERSIQHYINEKWDHCRNRLASIASDSIMQCNTLMPRMKNDLKSIHLCYIIIIIISILLCILLAISNLSKWILEGINEKQYIEEMKVGKANLEKRTKIFEQAKDEK